MRTLPRTLVGALFAGSIGFASIPARAAEPARRDEGIAIAVVFDTSGSMRQSIATRPGGPRVEKSRAAQSAFHAVLERLERFTKEKSAKPLAVGIYAFDRRNAIVARPLARFDAAALRGWLEQARFDASTPLGDAIFLAARDLIAFPAASRHILVLTDGENTAGRTPEKALEQLGEAAARKDIVVFTHVIALDIPPAVFAALKKQGATLIAASDETQLREKFDFILEEKILVEAAR